MRHVKLFIVILFFILQNDVYAQDSLSQKTYQPISIYFNNPLDMGNKIRVKIEARIDQHSAFLVGLSNYYGIWRGYNTSVEFKHYGDKKNNNLEKIRYLKGGWGVSLADEFSSNPNVTRGTYMYMGGGFGQHYTFGKTKSFFIEFTEGVKFTITTSGEVDLAGNGYRGLFYIAGPGAVFNFNINFGWHFGGESL
jgi:hypothetical protein